MTVGGNGDMNRRMWLRVTYALLTAPACSRAYYGGMEKLGIEKREILAGRVEAAKESQEKAQNEFEDALEQFRAVVGFDGDRLGEVYDDLKGAYRQAELQAEDVRERIRRVESVAEALFAEWEQELEQYRDVRLRQQSQQRLERTRRAYSGLLNRMQQAEAQMDPVLRVFQDHVLYLKHNLNAAAITSLEAEIPRLEKEVARLRNSMQRSIAEARRFIESQADA